MDVRILPGILSGSVNAPDSKSVLHRLVLLSALSGGGVIECSGVLSDDILATADCVKSLGGNVLREGTGLVVSPVTYGGEARLYCRESGSTLRFVLPIAAALGKRAEFEGSGRLPLRPNKPLTDALAQNGVDVKGDGLPITLDGKLKSGVFSIAGDVSSQYITGLLLALPLIGGGEIKLTSPLASKGYIDITLCCMQRFGVDVTVAESGFSVPAAPYKRVDIINCEGDWSGGAFLLAAGVLSGGVCVYGLDLNSSQGDKKFFDILTRMGADITSDKGKITAKPSALRAVSLDASDIPDLVPITAVLASAAEGRSEIYGVERLRLKESDRIAATLSLINSLGGNASFDGEKIAVEGCGRLKGGAADGFGDHRIVMSAAVASCICDSEVTVTGIESVAKSYPAFFEDFSALGGEFYAL